MTEEEVNIIIAEFMGGEYCKSDDMGYEIIGYEPYTYFDLECFKKSHPLFTGSLDTLVPVWEKLKSLPEMMIENEGLYLVEMLNEEMFVEINYVWAEKSSLQQAAAHATAKAIKELKL